MASSICSCRVLILLLLAPLLPASGQSEAGTSRVAGTVSRHDSLGMVPAGGVRVVLHRSGTDTSMALDSLLTGPDGTFQFRVRPTASDSAVYFASALHHGVAYFSAFAFADDLDSTSFDVAIADTTSLRVPLAIEGQHYFILAPAMSERRRIVQVFELENRSQHTAVASGDSVPVWSTHIPEGAQDFGPGPGISEGGLVLRDGAVELYSPFAPGLKQIFFAYTLPAAAFPLSFPLENDVGILELLVEETSATVTAPGLSESSPVSMPDLPGRMFRRFLLEDAPANTLVTIAVGPPEQITLNTLLLIVLLIVGVGMLVALAVSFRRVRPALVNPARVNVAAAAGVDALARQIAELDAAYASRAETGTREKKEYEAKRDQLKRQLAALLAKGRTTL